MLENQVPVYKKNSGYKAEIKGTQRLFKLVKNVFYKAEKVIESPVKNKAAWRGVKEYKEKECHQVDLKLFFKGVSFCVNCAGNNINSCHGNRKYIYRKASDMKEGILGT